MIDKIWVIYELLIGLFIVYAVARLLLDIGKTIGGSVWLYLLLLLVLGIKIFKWIVEAILD